MTLSRSRMCAARICDQSYKIVSLFFRQFSIWGVSRRNFDSVYYRRTLNRSTFELVQFCTFSHRYFINSIVLFVWIRFSFDSLSPSDVYIIEAVQRFRNSFVVCSRNVFIIAYSINKCIVKWKAFYSTYYTDDSNCKRMLCAMNYIWRYRRDTDHYSLTLSLWINGNLHAILFRHTRQCSFKHTMVVLFNVLSSSKI